MAWDGGGYATSKHLKCHRLISVSVVATLFACYAVRDAWRPRRESRVPLSLGLLLLRLTRLAFVFTGRPCGFFKTFGINGGLGLEKRLDLLLT